MKQQFDPGSYGTDSPHMHAMIVVTKTACFCLILLIERTIRPAVHVTVTAIARWSRHCRRRAKSLSDDRCCGQEQQLQGLWPWGIEKGAGGDNAASAGGGSRLNECHAVTLRLPAADVSRPVAFPSRRSAISSRLSSSHHRRVRRRRARRARWSSSNKPHTLFERLLTSTHFASNILI